MRHRIMTAAMTAALVGLGAGTALAQAPAHPQAPGPTFRADMRKLWEDHVTWTRLFIVDAAAGLPEQQATTQRLLHNQDEIGNAIKPFYGDEAGNRLTTLLKNHITGAAALVAAAKAGQSDSVDNLKKAWQANADSIATFLSGANPRNWPADRLKDEMHNHLDLTLQEATAQLHGDWSASIRAFDQVHDQILRMADMLSEGIIRQFPSSVANRGR